MRKELDHFYIEDSYGGNQEGKEAYETAADIIKEQIGRGLPVPYLMLLHRDKKLDDYMWHWFLLNGYDDEGGRLKVSVVSYGKKIWMDLHHLWSTGRLRKGGFIRVSCPLP